MANNFQRGDLTPVIFVPSGGTSVTLNITGHNLDIMSALYDVTHTGFGGVGTARIAGKPDASGSVKMDYDADRTPYALSLLNGIRGLMLFYLTPTRAIQVPVIIEKVSYVSTRDSQISFGCEVKMDVIAGLLVYGTN